MSDVCSDTDVASRLQKENAPAWIAPQLVGRRVWITFVTVGERAKWAEVRSWGAPARARLEVWLAARDVIPYDEEVARTWDWLAARAQRRGRPRDEQCGLERLVEGCCWRLVLLVVPVAAGRVASGSSLVASHV